MIVSVRTFFHGIIIYKSRMSPDVISGGIFFESAGEAGESEWGKTSVRMIPG